MTMTLTDIKTSVVASGEDSRESLVASSHVTKTRYLHEIGSNNGKYRIHLRTSKIVSPAQSSAIFSASTSLVLRMQ